MTVCSQWLWALLGERAAEVRYRPKNKPPATSAERGLRFATRRGILNACQLSGDFYQLVKTDF